MTLCCPNGGREVIQEYYRHCWIYGIRSDPDLTQQVMSVCSGISGLGEKRILEEGGRILHADWKLDPIHTASVAPTGLNHQPVEQSLQE